MEITVWDIFVQSLGIIGIIASVMSFQCEKYKKLIALRTANEFFFALQYMLLGAYTGMAMNIIGCARNLIFAKTVEKNKSTLLGRIVFSVFFLVFTVLTWAGAKSAIVGVAKVLSTVAYGNKNTSFVRALIFLTSAIWLVYNWLVGSYAGCVCEILTLGSIIIGFLRIDIPKLLKKAKADA